MTTSPAGPRIPLPPADLPSLGLVDPDAAVPGWARELVTRLTVSPQLVLAGNVADVHVLRDDRGNLGFRTTSQVTHRTLVEVGYEVVLHWHVVGGLTVRHPVAPRGKDGEASPPDPRIIDLLGSQTWERRTEPDAAVLADIVQSVVVADQPVALIVEGAQRISPVPTDERVHRLYVVAHRLATLAKRQPLPLPPGRSVYSPVIWLVDRESDLPHWLIATQGVQVLSVPEPTLTMRSQAAALLVPALPGGAGLDDAQREAVVKRLAEESEGFSLDALRSVLPLAIDRGISAHDVEDAVRFLRSGLRRSPWRDPVVLRRIERAHTTLGEQVLGQPQAVRAASDILARAAVGLAGAQAAGHSSRPQGVMFFAGPTGVGKTELAKQIAALVFGREDAMVRFDMSEFSAEHTEARLLGAPPGYVGHEAGGELTNAVRTRPFSLLLFDEIEKANRRILDKFLQILEDGRLTDGAGSTVHFGETLIVFTSNLGVLETDVTGNQAQIPYRTTYETLRQKVSTSIRHEFVALTNRPELLNRIGDNIVVFDYIRPETAIRIAHRNLENLAERVRATRGARLAFGPDFLRAIDEAVTAEEVLVNGGRGVGSLIESRVVNPLARHLLNEHATRLEITSFGDDASGHHLTVVAAGRP